MAGGVAPLIGLQPRLWLGPASARLLTDADVAAMFCRMFALPPGTVSVVLDVDVPDQVLTAAFQPAGAAKAAHYLASPGPGNAPEHRARLREPASPSRVPHRRRAQTRPVPWPCHPRGQVLHVPAPGPRLYLRDPTDGRLGRFALMVSGTDRDADGDHLATGHSAHAHVRLG